MTSQEFTEAVRQAARITEKDLDVATLRRNFATAVGDDPHLMSHFCERHFAAHPELRGLFPRYLEHQETAFERLLLEILDHLDDGAWLQLHLFSAAAALAIPTCPKVQPVAAQQQLSSSSGRRPGQ